MPAISSSAPGKIILVGEHAVVYGQPAIAIPIHQLRARAYFLANPAGPKGRIHIIAPNIDLEKDLEDLGETHPFTRIFELIKSQFEIEHFPSMDVKIVSDIPIAAGLGSGTAVSIALIRGLVQFIGETLDEEEVSRLAFEVEKIYHGTPSGIDNSVVTYGKPIYFIKNVKPEILSINDEFYFVVADSGIKSETSQVVRSVRNGWQNAKIQYELLFNEIGALSTQAKDYLLEGLREQLGVLMNKNHELLCRLGVSNIILDRLVNSAIMAGALGAKLSGAGAGGNIIALVPNNRIKSVQEALREAGAVKVILTSLPKKK